MTSFFGKASIVGGVATIAALLTAPAQAGIVMKYAVNGGAFTTITDNQAGADLASATDGTIAFMLLGVGGITISLNSGNNGDYQSGSPVQLHLNTTGTVANTAAADSLEVWVTSTDYVLPAGAHKLRSDFGVSANPGSVTWESYFDASNAQFGTGTLLESHTTNAQGAAAGETAIDDVTTTDDPFSLSQRFLVTWGAGTAGAINLVGTQTEIPEPAALALMGMGLLGLGVIRRRKTV